LTCCWGGLIQFLHMASRALTLPHACDLFLTTHPEDCMSYLQKNIFICIFTTISLAKVKRTSPYMVESILAWAQAGPRAWSGSGWVDEWHGECWKPPPGPCEPITINEQKHGQVHFDLAMGVSQWRIYTSICTCIYIIYIYI
jgi:hypothetical protein